MHPEIVRAQFGHCPICGMALEPREPGGNDEGNAEFADMTRRFWVAVVLTVPLLALVMSDYLPGLQVARAARRGPVAGTRAQQSGGSVGGMAVFRSRLGLGSDAKPQYVHLDRARRRRCVSLQPRRGAISAPISGGAARLTGRSCHILRSGGGDHDARTTRTSSRTARAQRNQCGHPVAARTGPQDRATDTRGRRRRRRSACGRPHRRPPSRSPGGKSSGGRHRRRRLVVASTNRRLPANRYRSKNSPAIASSARP